MAAPHVAGLIATLISRNGNCSPVEMSNTLHLLANKDVLGGVRKYRYLIEVTSL